MNASTSVRNMLSIAFGVLGWLTLLYAISGLYGLAAVLIASNPGTTTESRAVADLGKIALLELLTIKTLAATFVAFTSLLLGEVTKAVDDIQRSHMIRSRESS